MTDKQKSYFNSIIERVKILNEDQKKAFTEAVEADKDCKTFCIDYAKKLESEMRTGVKKAVRNAKMWEEHNFEGADVKTRFVARFIINTLIEKEG